MEHREVARVWLAVQGAAKAPDSFIDALESLLRRTFKQGLEYRVKRKEQEKSNKCLRCSTGAVDLIECELDAFDAFGMFCLPCRDLNWELLREANER